MQIESNFLDGVLIIQVYENRLTAKIATEFKEYLHQAINEGKHHLVINLTEVTFIDSSGLGALVSGLKTLGNRGDMILCGMNDSVHQLFKLTRMDKVFKSFETQSEAVRGFK